MPIPDFQKMMIPFLSILGDGNEHELREVRDYIANHFNLTAEERQEKLPAGNQTRLANRVGWARTHLNRALLLEYVSLGIYKITQRGKDLLKELPATIDVKYLNRYPEHKEWLEGSNNSEGQIVVPIATASPLMPEEQMASLSDTLKKNLVSDLIETMRAMSPRGFERLVLDVLVAMGYGGSRAEAAEIGSGIGDGGIDGLINEDRLGLDRIYVQAKRWQNTVNSPEVHSFVGALSGKHAQKGVFITTSEFSSGAREYVKNLPQRIILIDGQRLAELMIEHNVGVSRSYSYEIKQIDTDYFVDA